MARGCHYLLDYKSNLAGEDSAAYKCAWLRRCRRIAGDLQYQLYTLALHRYLLAVIALANYDYANAISGGVIHLFTRDSERPRQGILLLALVAALINQLDDMFAGEMSE